ncbi:LEM domain-containing protein 1 isoform X1 [Brachyistius frenatus]|uniref:LEM domain-containing protein 1 isoform X1 n=1 Tax=Brachyistius frenatus TaxID=100188 RepID=UPI0037E836DD
MPFVEDPALLPKSRLKLDLVAHNVALPPAASKKEVYVELHLKHIDQKNAADFSSDEEDQAPDAADEEEGPWEAAMPDPSSLTDDDLKATLLKHGVKAGPIVASTRALYEKKLRTLLQSDGYDRLNGAEKAVLYSDSEEEEDDEEEEVEVEVVEADEEVNGEEEDKESVSQQQETVEQLNKAQQKTSQAELHFQIGDFSYPQCFLRSSKLRVPTSRNSEPSSKWNSRNALESSERSRSRCSQLPAGIIRASSVDQRSRLGSGLPQEPVKDILKDLYPDTAKTPTGIYATCRRPIKGAAGRPVQYAYPDPPSSPLTLERREVARRLVPIHIQILVFLIVVCILYLIYVSVEDSSSVNTLLDSLNQWSDSEEGVWFQVETQDTQVGSGQD